jgi:hypothetical protein
MHAIKLNVQENVFDKFIYFLQNLLKNELKDSIEEFVKWYKEFYTKIKK